MQNCGKLPRKRKNRGIPARKFSFSQDDESSTPGNQIGDIETEDDEEASDPESGSKAAKKKESEITKEARKKVVEKL